nr:ribonuclease H-like domain, reverse transcriptase, RNA-dependent DNA polymerase [Tanacetum cinerariifolium]
MSDIDSLVNSVHEGDAPEQKVIPPPQITTVTSLSAKFPYLKKGKYDMWAMKMQNYISSTDLQCWNIVQKGNSQKNITSDTEGNIIIAPPVTVEEHMQVQREEQARTMLLTALPDEHIGDFYHMIDAKQIWSAIKARFGGNAELTRMRRSLLKHQFEEYKASEEEGLDGGYNKMYLKKAQTTRIIRRRKQQKMHQNLSALVVIDGSQGVNRDKQIQENTTEPGVLGNYGFVAEKGTNFVVPADDVVPADAVPASAFIFAEPTIPTDRKLLDQASVEKQDLMAKLENEKSLNAKWLSTSKNLHKLVDSSMTARTKRGLGFTKVNHYKGVPPPMNGNYMPTSTSPDTDESPRHYGKQTFESTEIKSTSKNFKFPFDFSDRSSVPTASDSCVENSRPNNVVNDSDDFTSRISTSGSEEQVDNVCSPQEDLSSSTSLGFDVQSSDSMYCNFHNHNGKGILGKGPSENHVNTSYKRCFPIPADKSFGSQAYTPYYLKSKHFPTSHNFYYSMHLANGTFRGTAVKPSAGWPWTKQNYFYSQGSKINDGSKSKSRLHTCSPQGRSKSFMAWISKIADSGCSRSMSGNRDKLDAFVDFDSASRPDITFAMSACARNQVSSTVSNLNAVKRIFKYITGHPKLGLWYPRDSPFDLEAFSDSDYVGAAGDRKSTTGGCQFMGRRHFIPADSIYSCWKLSLLLVNFDLLESFTAN